MTGKLPKIIEAAGAARDQALEVACSGLGIEELLRECRALEDFRRRSDNLYERVRALFFLYAIHRFELPARPGFQKRGHVPYAGWLHLLERRYEEALTVFLIVIIKISWISFIDFEEIESQGCLAYLSRSS